MLEKGKGKVTVVDCPLPLPVLSFSAPIPSPPQDSRIRFVGVFASFQSQSCKVVVFNVEYYKKYTPSGIVSQENGRLHDSLLCNLCIFF